MWLIRVNHWFLQMEHLLEKLASYENINVRWMLLASPISQGTGCLGKYQLPGSSDEAIKQEYLI